MIKRLASIAKHMIAPGQIDVPRDDAPFPALWIEIEVVVFSSANVVMMDRFDDGPVTVVALEIDIFSPPVFGLVAAGVSVYQRVQIGLVGGLAFALVGKFAPAVHHFIEIAVGQIVFLQEMAVLIFDREIESPKVTSILVGRTLLLFVDHTQTNPMSSRSVDSSQVEKAEADSFVHSLLAATAVIAL